MILTEFCNKYGVSKGSIYTYKCNGTIPKEIFTVLKQHNETHIDESYFIRRKDFKTKAVQFSHDMYYLMSEFMTDTEIARVISSTGAVPITMENIRQYMSRDMWALRETYITSSKLTRYEWYMFRFFRWMHMAIKRRYKDFDLQKTLDMIGGLNDKAS